jgi:lysophospholipase L1-like esterase
MFLPGVSGPKQRTKRQNPSLQTQRVPEWCRNADQYSFFRAILAALIFSTLALMPSCTHWPKITPTRIDLSHIAHPAVMLAGDSNFQRWSIHDIGRYHVINAGVNGIKAQGYYNFARAVAWTDTPDLIVVMLGTNDADKGTTLADYEKSLHATVAFLKTKAHVIMLGILPQESERDSRLPAYNKAAKAVAAAEGVPFTDLRPLFIKPGYTRDKVHLSDAGYSILEAVIARQLPDRFARIARPR